MNRRQKILTLIFLLLFIATLIWFPWHRWYDDPDRFYLVFLRFENMEADWWTIGFEWLILAVLYLSLFAILKDRRSQ